MKVTHVCYLDGKVPDPTKISMEVQRRVLGDSQPATSTPKTPAAPQHKKNKRKKQPQQAQQRKKKSLSRAEYYDLGEIDWIPFDKDAL